MNEHDNNTRYTKVISLLTVFLLCLMAGAVLGYTVGVGHGERNAMIACGWKK